MKRKFLCFSLVLGMALSGITVSAGDIHSLLPDKAHEAAVIREVSGGNTAQTKKYYEIVPFFFKHVQRAVRCVIRYVLWKGWSAMFIHMIPS